MPYAVKTAKNLITWYEHELYPMVMEINQSYMEVTNVVMYYDTRTNPHIEKKYIYNNT